MADDDDDTPSVTIEVKMSCGACVERIQKTLMALDGVSTAAVDLQTKTATFAARASFLDARRRASC